MTSVPSIAGIYIWLPYRRWEHVKPHKGVRRCVRPARSEIAPGRPSVRSLARQNYYRRKLVVLSGSG